MSNTRHPTGKFVTEAQMVEAFRAFRQEHLHHDHRGPIRKGWDWLCDRAAAFLMRAL